MSIRSNCCNEIITLTKKMVSGERYATYIMVFELRFSWVVYGMKSKLNHYLWILAKLIIGKHKYLIGKSRLQDLHQSCSKMLFDCIKNKFLICIYPSRLRINYFLLVCLCYFYKFS